jgi:hypothetical protein
LISGIKVNIVFVYNDDVISPANSSAWRGEMFYKAIKKTGLHSVELIKSSDFLKNSTKSNVVCTTSQLIVIEGSPDLDLLTIVNYWKSRGKKVAVDITISSERFCNDSSPAPESAFSIAHMYSNYQNRDFANIDQADRFRWGLHLADCILVSSLQQQLHWQVTAPVKLIREYIDLDIIRDTVKFKHDLLVIGIISNLQTIDPLLQSVLNAIGLQYPQVKWLPIIINQKHLNVKSESIISNLPSGLTSQWPNPTSLMDLGIFWDVQSVRGEFNQNILEFMALRIPWALNDQKGYHEFTNYGLMIQSKKNWQSSLIEMVQKIIINASDTEKGYLYAIGHNIEDHVHEILTTFAEIIKIP